MRTPVPPPLPDPGPDVPDHEKIPQSWVAGIPEFQKTVATFKMWVLLGAIALGLAFASIGIVALVALHHSDQNTKRLDDRSAARDRIQAQTDAKLNKQAADIAALQQKSQAAVCALVIGSVQQDRDAGNPPDPLVLKFASDYGCVVPQALGGPNQPRAPRRP